MRGEGGGLTWADLMSKEEGYVSRCADAENASEEELTSFKAELPTLLKTAAATVSTRVACDGGSDEYVSAPTPAPS